MSLTKFKPGTCWITGEDKAHWASIFKVLEVVDADREVRADIIVFELEQVFLYPRTLYIGSDISKTAQPITEQQFHTVWAMYQDNGYSC